MSKRRKKRKPLTRVAKLSGEKAKEAVREVPGSDGMWWNMMTMSLPEISETPIKIRVVDALSSKASEFNAR